MPVRVDTCRSGAPPAPPSRAHAEAECRVLVTASGCRRKERTDAKTRNAGPCGVCWRESHDSPQLLEDVVHPGDPAGSWMTDSAAMRVNAGTTHAPRRPSPDREVRPRAPARCRGLTCLIRHIPDVALDGIQSPFIDLTGHKLDRQGQTIEGIHEATQEDRVRLIWALNPSPQQTNSVFLTKWRNGDGIDAGMIDPRYTRGQYPTDPSSGPPA